MRDFADSLTCLDPDFETVMCDHDWIDDKWTQKEMNRVMEDPSFRAPFFCFAYQSDVNSLYQKVTKLFDTDNEAAYELCLLAFKHAVFSELSEELSVLTSSCKLGIASQPDKAAASRKITALTMERYNAERYIINFIEAKAMAVKMSQLNDN